MQSNAADRRAGEIADGICATLDLLPLDAAIEVVTQLAGWPGYETDWKKVSPAAMYALLAIYQARALDVQQHLLRRIGHGYLSDHYADKLMPHTS